LLVVNQRTVLRNLYQFYAKKSNHGSVNLRIRAIISDSGRPPRSSSEHPGLHAARARQHHRRCVVSPLVPHSWHLFGP
jgi:hypothetical protein